MYFISCTPTDNVNACQNLNLVNMQCVFKYSNQVMFVKINYLLERTKKLLITKKQKFVNLPYVQKDVLTYSKSFSELKNSNWFLTNRKKLINTSAFILY